MSARCAAAGTWALRSRWWQRGGRVDLLPLPQLLGHWGGGGDAEEEDAVEDVQEGGLAGAAVQRGPV